MRKILLTLMVLTFGLNSAKFSFGILTHNEASSLQLLLNFLVSHREDGDEIVIVDDFSTNEETLQVLHDFEGTNNFSVYKRQLDMNFAAQRNFLKSKCSGDYCFFLDADECPSEQLMGQLRNIVSTGFDSYGVPRINLVEDIDPKDKRLNQKGYVSWPDYQERIFKNSNDLYYVKNVHEALVSNKKKRRSNVPGEEKYAIVHQKHIKTWENAHQLYLKCYKNWLIEALKNKRSIVVRNIMMDNPLEHCMFVKDLEVQEIIPEQKRRRILRACNSIIDNKDISSMSRLINLLNSI
jgi:glycosyltransferase involved in cell wall biosynthesis